MDNIEMPRDTVSRIEKGISLGWADANPELFGRSMVKFLIECPPEQWNITVERAYMPGETWNFVAVRKEAEEATPPIRGHVYRNFIYGFDPGGNFVFAQREAAGSDVCVWRTTAPTPELDLMDGKLDDHNRGVYVEVRDESPHIRDIRSSNAVNPPNNPEA